MTGDILSLIDLTRLGSSVKKTDDQKSELGQFFTPAPIARLMASMLKLKADHVRLLDAGAGYGCLFASVVSDLAKRKSKPHSIDITAYEADAGMEPHLRETIRLCSDLCRAENIKFEAHIVVSDFIGSAVETLEIGLFERPRLFNCAILNPPYRKINSDSDARLTLRRVGIETSNLYTGFLSLSLMLLEKHGELVAITPRSFCNGPYFLPFRKQLLDSTAIKRIHLFESRDKAFKDDNVLQENIIFHAVKGAKAGATDITQSTDAESASVCRKASFEQLVNPADSQRFIHIVPDDNGSAISSEIGSLPCTLADLNLTVSTGRVVDFRAREFLKKEPEKGAVPLIYPTHFKNGFVLWPKATKKPNAIADCPKTEFLTVPNGNYVLVKRFSSKEERRRVVAAVHQKDDFNFDVIGFENHVNYFHSDGRGIPIVLAKGLALFLNSTIVDLYFRQFNGHTQVNATDLRSFKFPTRKQLEALGNQVNDAFPDQAGIDTIVNRELF